MLIKGKFRTFGFWFSTIGVIGGLAAPFYFLFFGFGKTPIAGQCFFYLVDLILLATYGRMLYDANLVLIDTNNRTIAFTNRFTRITKTYSFSNFDGKLTTNEPIKGGWIRNYYLIKNKKAVKKLTSFIYSNQVELEEALIELPDLGSFKYSYVKTWKISFGLPIL